MTARTGLWMGCALAMAVLAGPALAEDGEAAPSGDRDRQLIRSYDLETQIRAERERQEALLEEVQSGRAAERALTPEEELRLHGGNWDPRIARGAPEDRSLPLAIFEKEHRTVARGEWGNEAKLQVVARSLDADEDGRPEQVRYFDEKTGTYLRKDQDRNYDGKIDAWQDYVDGQLVRRALDEGGDGEPDAWETYEGGWLTSREVDRDEDGVRDAFFHYEGDSLVLERHDVDNDGNLDRVVEYSNRFRVRQREDRDLDDRFDHWIEFAVHEDEEMAVRVERDTVGDGSPDLFEIYEPSDGGPVIAVREEDKNGDGTVDITSIYENGKLVRREISDPDLMPL